MLIFLNKTKKNNDKKKMKNSYFLKHKFCNFEIFQK